MKLTLDDLNLQILGHETRGKYGKEEINQLVNCKVEI
jgi:hypothetical protein